MPKYFYNAIYNHATVGRPLSVARIAALEDDAVLLFFLA